MASFLVRRFLLMVPTLIVISIISFLIIDLPPGSYVDSYVAELAQTEHVEPEVIANLRARYGLDKPIYVRYFRWISQFVQGNFGFSLAWNLPVRSLIGQRLALTIVVSLASTIFAWVVAFPIGVLSAVKQYSFYDNFATLVGFLGLAIPNFLLALILMFFSYRFFGGGIGGLFSAEYASAPWSIAKFIDFLKHLWIPMVVVGTAGTAGLIRILRANLLDELRKAYVVSARSHGVPEGKLLFKYPIRIAINPFISTVGWLLPQMISGATITAIVLALPTAGPLFLVALRQQDMELAGSFVMLTATLTVIGTLISDILLAIVDPRIRYE